MFKATDGTLFTNRNKYRKYEMETQYTFRNKIGETLVKAPGSVQGQPFDIINSKECEFQILDHCDQVQIDDTRDSKFFIGACSESVFVRNCHNCIFTVACKQLRTRDCSNCTFYLYCKTEPIIETSSAMCFAPFNGAFPGHERFMTEAGLSPSQNRWFAIFDFNDDNKSGKNWRILDQSEELPLWCPLGPAENCCPRVEKGSPAIIHDPKLPCETMSCTDRVQSFSFVAPSKSGAAQTPPNNSNPFGTWGKYGRSGLSFLWSCLLCFVASALGFPPACSRAKSEN